MSLLPTTNTFTRNTPPSWSSQPHKYGRSFSSRPLIIQRLVHWTQMDFDVAIWQMAYLLIAPKRVYRNVYYHKQTKNQWARDDPAFFVLLTGLMAISGAAWAVVYGKGWWNVLYTSAFMVLVDFLLIGSLVATVTWWITNRFLKFNRMSYAVDQNVEWAYAFDVHCNAYIPFFLILYILQFFFLPLLRANSNWIALFVGNTMYFCAIVWYMYGIFIGFKALPFLVHTEIFVYPSLLVFALYIASLFGYNISQHVLGFYFG
ncbi:hypothetical protein LRAMOSA01336 [Lichtheimia ramosa]|uniref:UNC-50-like protein n=1 Tax=Lichtheimia ramosa TaxID=688394 RepID=A0A077WLI2_9FUNG|nr:hypothetical protein LRAMOSA01336 [Lichtheimia ramosa]